MKKLRISMLLAAAALSLAACTPSNITAEESTSVPEGVMATEGETISLKDRPTVEYVIPEDAPTGVDGGPGVMETTAVDNSFYPDDKQSPQTTAEAEGEEAVVCLYGVNDTGVVQTMAEAAGMDADSLIAAMVEEGILAAGTEVSSFSQEGAGTEVSSFSQEGNTAELALNQLEAVYQDASEEQILACVVNTMTENLGLESISVKAGDKDYGQQSYTDEYNAT